MAKWVFLNDGFVDEESAFIHFKDLSFQRGYGIFDFFRLVGNEPLFLNDHLDRFHFSAGKMRLRVRLEREALAAAIHELISRNNLPYWGIRLSLTGGSVEDGFGIGEPALLISQHPFAPPTEEQRQTGIRLFSYSHQRQLPQVKTIDYLMAVWLQPKRMEHGADDILYRNNGFITECPRNNFFLVTKDNRIVTPSDDILKGVTRRKVIEIARQDFVVEERPVHLSEIETAKEAFVTSTTKQILPVAAIDQTVFTEQKVATQLLHRFRKTFCGD